jgi:hypothetical protein
LKKTKSEKVPPVSTDTLYFVIDFPGVDFLTLTSYTINFARQQFIWNLKKDSSPAARNDTQRPFVIPNEVRDLG